MSWLLGLCKLPTPPADLDDDQREAVIETLAGAVETMHMAGIGLDRGDWLAASPIERAALVRGGRRHKISMAILEAQVADSMVAAGVFAEIDGGDRLEDMIIDRAAARMRQRMAPPKGR